MPAKKNTKSKTPPAAVPPQADPLPAAEPQTTETKREVLDARQQLVRDHVPLGARAKFLHHAEQNHGYEICKDADGNPVKHGASVLGYIPAVAEAQ